MPGLRKHVARCLTAAACALCAASVAVAQPGSWHRRRVPPDVEATASVTLNALTVRTLRVDRPWNPGICIGCDGTIAAVPGRPFGRSRR